MSQREWKNTILNNWCCCAAATVVVVLPTKSNERLTHFHNSSGKTVMCLYNYHHYRTSPLETKGNENKTGKKRHKSGGNENAIDKSVVCWRLSRHISEVSKWIWTAAHQVNRLYASTDQPKWWKCDVVTIRLIPVAAECIEFHCE